MRSTMIHLDAQVHRRLVVSGLAGCFFFCRCGTGFAAPETFLIFFENQSSELISSANEIVRAISDRVRPNARIAINGHCDTSEADPDKLSLARALAVQKALLAAKLAAGATITVAGKVRRSRAYRPGPRFRSRSTATCRLWSSSAAAISALSILRAGQRHSRA